MSVNVKEIQGGKRTHDDDAEVRREKMIARRSRLRKNDIIGEEGRGHVPFPEHHASQLRRLER